MREFYRGVDSALLRTAIYTTMRIGLFFSLSDALRARKRGAERISLLEKIGCALVAGSVSSFLATPFDVTLVRLQSDLTLPPALRRNYRNALHAAAQISREEGLRALWSGARPTVLRAVAANVSMLVCFSEFKERLL